MQPEAFARLKRQICDKRDSTSEFFDASDIIGRREFWEVELDNMDCGLNNLDAVEMVASKEQNQRAQKEARKQQKQRQRQGQVQDLDQGQGQSDDTSPPQEE